MSTKFRTGTLALAIGLALGTAPSFAAGFEEKAAKLKDVERIVREPVNVREVPP